MSRVFLATETGLTRSVVVKILTPELAAEVSAERFAREVKLAARLQQANIVPLLNAGNANGLPWYSMPFVRGESLRAKLSSDAAVPITDAVHICATSRGRSPSRTAKEWRIATSSRRTF